MPGGTKNPTHWSGEDKIGIWGGSDRANNTPARPGWKRGTTTEKPTAQGFRMEATARSRDLNGWKGVAIQRRCDWTRQKKLTKKKKKREIRVDPPRQPNSPWMMTISTHQRSRHGADHLAAPYQDYQPTTAIFARRSTLKKKKKIRLRRGSGVRACSHLLA